MSHSVRKVAAVLTSPIQRILAIEAASGIALVVATVAALIWANAWTHSYSDFWRTQVVERPLQFWVNDALMPIFFFVVGLEIRREIADGELAGWKKAALPLAAAVGGMVVPAAIFSVLNAGRAGSAGWGVPMATDIAFAVGVLTLLGSRVPSALRVMLLALAVIDDIGAIVVIAIFYGGGIHPAVAGVAIGLLVPVRRKNGSPISDRVIRILHPWVAFVVMPLFALANAGVTFGSLDLSGDHRWLFAGVVAGLVIGKPLGIAAASLGASRLGIATRSEALTRSAVVLVGMVGGIGFTMSLFIAQLAFPAGPLLDTAKLAIVVGAGVASAFGLAFGLVTYRKRVAEA
jgi:NhaA family Na+:H+ antiporter